jgi:1,4-dihydroxy-2-naphthoyl-CoA hydrolase
MDSFGQLHQRLKGTFPDLRGIRFLEAAPESVRASMLVRPELCTVGNDLHGGASMAYADTLGALATILNLSLQQRSTTLVSKTNCLRPSPAGVTFAGCVGRSGGAVDITALGDHVNVAARLALQPAAGEVLVSEAAFQAAGLDLGNLEKRALQLKGKTDTVSVSVWQA